MSEIREQAVRALVSPEFADHAFDALRAHCKDNSWGSREALLSTVEFLRARYAKARCDSDGVSCCVRCQTMFLVRKMEALLVASSKLGGSNG